MKKLITLIAAAFIAAPVFALGLGNDNPSANSTNLNANANTQGQAQGQGQLQGQLQGQGQGQGQAQLTNVDVSNRISNDVRNNAAAFAGAVSGAKSNSNSSSSATGGNANAVSAGGAALAGSSSGGNTLTVNEAAIPADTSVRYSGNYTVKGVPNVISGAIYPTAPCMGSTSVGGSGVGFGLSIGHTWKDDECGIRETSRSFNGMGLKEDALKVLCSSEYAKAAPSCAKQEAEIK